MSKEIPCTKEYAGDCFHLGEGTRPSEMGRVGFEPTTNALKGHCSSAELPTQTKGKRLCVAQDGD